MIATWLIFIILQPTPNESKKVIQGMPNDLFSKVFFFYGDNIFTPFLTTTALRLMAIKQIFRP
jgi:hypothetical protein